ncbi:cytochrome c oxidase assembly protein [Shinella sp. BYT-45]|uniref:cytochrome c oxidase assembly protein n=1 Tax=Shinella sp. BYT-45 TaxID=3377377 RepID=UPI00397F2DEA
MKRIALVTGLCLLGVLGATLAASFGNGSFTAHMVVHMGVVAVASPLIAYGIADTPHDPFPPPARPSPILASIVELVVVWFWHVPAMRLVADGSLALTLVEQASFLAAGLLLWLACFRPDEGRLAGAIGLLFTSMHMTLLGVLLALAPRPLYGEGDVTCFGMPLSAAADQQIGGVVMLMTGAFAYLAGGIVLLAGLLREDAKLPTGKPRC